MQIDFSDKEIQQLFIVFRAAMQSANLMINPLITNLLAKFKKQDGFSGEVKVKIPAEGEKK